MGLFTPIWMSGNLYGRSDRKLERAIEKVLKLDDDNLIKAATEAPCPDIRYAALKKLDSQTVLARIALTDSKEHIRKFAADKITDPVLLEKVIAGNKDLAESLSLLVKFPDAALTESELKNLCSSEYKTRYDAVEGLNNQKILAEVARKEKDHGIRQRAVEKLSDQAALTEVALKEEDGYIRGIAVNKLDDQAVLAGIARNDKSDMVRRDAVKKLTDLSVLTEIAHTDKSIIVISAAVRLLGKNTDIAAVERITEFLKTGTETDKGSAAAILKEIYSDVQLSDKVKKCIRANEGNYKYNSHSDSGCYMHEDSYSPFIHFDVQ